MGKILINETKTERIELIARKETVDNNINILANITIENIGKLEKIHVEFRAGLGSIPTILESLQELRMFRDLVNKACELLEARESA